MLNMHGADIDDHRHIRPGDGGQIRDLPEMVHTHFQHSDLCILRHGQDRHRHADIVIVIDRGLAGAVGGLQHRRDHFLGGALAHGAGDAHYLHTDPVPLATGDLPQCDSGILYDNRRIIAVTVGAQHRSRTFFQCGRDKIMSVPLALQSNKQLLRLQLAGIVIGT